MRARRSAREVVVCQDGERVRDVVGPGGVLSVYKQAVLSNDGIVVLVWWQLPREGEWKGG